MTKQLPTAIIFTHRGKECDGLVLADKGICWQAELIDGTIILVQKKHVTKELFSEDSYFEAPEPDQAELGDPDPEADEPPAADSLASMLTKIRADGKVAKPKRQPKAPATPVAKPATDTSIITLKQLCAELNIEPRIARRRLRNSQGQVGTGSRWEWQAKDKVLADIRKAIKG